MNIRRVYETVIGCVRLPNVNYQVSPQTNYTTHLRERCIKRLKGTQWYQRPQN